MVEIQCNLISGLFRFAAKGWISTYMIDTIKEYSPEHKINHTKLKKNVKYYDTTSAVVVKFKQLGASETAECRP